ncbi:MAG: LytR C-terminal domain-containing protein [Acidimicrobiales bacterium]
MTAPGRYAADDNSFARSAGGAAGRGVVLIAVAVVVGLVLLWKGFDGADGSGPRVSAGGDSAAAGGGTDSGATDDVDSGDDGTGDAAGDDATGDDQTDVGDPGATGEVPPTGTHLPGEVKVAVANGVGEAGLAGSRRDALTTQGFVATPKNTAAAEVEASAIYYRPDFSEDAKVVAQALGAPADIITAAPDDVLSLIRNSDDVAEFDIFVILGTDRVAG